MKLALYEHGGETRPGIISDRGIVDVSSAVTIAYTPQLTMAGIIDAFDDLRSELESLERSGSAMSLTPFACARRCRGPAKFSPASPITGNMRSARRVRSTCS